MTNQCKTRNEAHRMLGEAVELWLEAASATEIKRRLKRQSFTLGRAWL